MVGNYGTGKCGTKMQEWKNAGKVGI